MKCIFEANMKMLNDNLTDLSEGMLSTAKDNLLGIEQIIDYSDKLYPSPNTSEP